MVTFLFCSHSCFSSEFLLQCNYVQSWERAGLNIAHGHTKISIYTFHLCFFFCSFSSRYGFNYIPMIDIVKIDKTNKKCDQIRINIMQKLTKYFCMIDSLYEKYNNEYIECESNINSAYIFFFINFSLNHGFAWNNNILSIHW